MDDPGAAEQQSDSREPLEAWHSWRDRELRAGGELHMELAESHWAVGEVTRGDGERWRMTAVRRGEGGSMIWMERVETTAPATNPDAGDPEDIPLAQDMRRLMSFRRAEAHADHLVLYESPASIEWLLAFFRENMRTQGWKIEQDFQLEMPDSEMNPYLLFHKSQRQCFVALGRRGESCAVSLMLRHQPQEHP